MHTNQEPIDERLVDNPLDQQCQIREAIYERMVEDEFSTEFSTQISRVDETLHRYKLIAGNAKVNKKRKKEKTKHVDVVYDEITHLLYFKITEEDFARGWKSYGMKLVTLEQDKYSITKKMVHDEKLKLSKLAFTLCQKINGVYEQLTETTYSDFMEEGCGQLQMVSIPKTVCENGDEMIVISFIGGPLEKDGCKLQLNGVITKKFEKNRNTFVFKSIQKSTECDYLHVIIIKKNIFYNVSPGEPEYRVLVDTKILYVKHAG
ncbi:unnamed protein product [Didymodactylos carnosus]|uniref:Uncharacterized protein n=1 Tax=Didymodactylos carnosus TaxID=1234261 RepID=A0A8S2EZC5_9BILA|nr:unnamed protein product [Didymodactylos carnosus]CAF4164114.1 unnamed protein product [Didymodactylos carnosus]